MEREDGHRIKVPAAGDGASPPRGERGGHATAFPGELAREDMSHEATPPDEEAARIERFVGRAREATERTYLLLRENPAAMQALARALPESAADLYRAGQGQQAERLAGQLAKTLRPAGAAPDDAFVEGVRRGFAAGCLIQWRVLEYLIGEELPLWPVQRYSSDRQVD